MDIVCLCNAIIQREPAYESEGDNISCWKNSKTMENSATNIEDLQIRGEVIMQPQRRWCEKRNPLDFALWKAQNQMKLSWNSPWGKVVDCSILNAHNGDKTLSDTIVTFTVVDKTAFPHHENEIAQSESKTGRNCELLDAQRIRNNGQRKWSKSLGRADHDLIQQLDTLLRVSSNQCALSSSVEGI